MTRITSRIEVHKYQKRFELKKKEKIVTYCLLDKCNPPMLIVILMS